MMTNNHLKKIVQFYPDGSLREIYYLNSRNQKHYLHNTFDMKGKPEESVYYRNGRPHGLFTYHQPGIGCMSYRFYKNGNHHGQTQIYWPKKCITTYYYNGNELFERTDEKLIEKCIQDQNDIKQFWNDFTFEVISTETYCNGKLIEINENK